jgi:cyclopropane fatty-acyl-phospholipid synthase-like methyltransferase
MSTDNDWLASRFPRSSRYNFAWQAENSFGGNPVWLAEWLGEALPLSPGMRVLDLGCGRAKSSVFLVREFGVQVTAVDLWINASENLQRISHAGLEDKILPLHCDARALPFAAEQFDAIVSLDAYFYFGTDDLYLNYLTGFLRPGGWLGIAGAGLMQEITGEVPEHLKSNWDQGYWCLHSAPWWRRLWERTGLVDVKVSDAMPDGGRVWLEWHRRVHPHNRAEIESLEADAGRNIGYTRTVAQRRAGVKPDEFCWPNQIRLPAQFDPLPILASDA